MIDDDYSLIGEKFQMTKEKKCLMPTPTKGKGGGKGSGKDVDLKDCPLEFKKMPPPGVPK